jgi:hypothetical protein
MTNSTLSWVGLLPVFIIVLSPPNASEAAERSDELLSGHPRFSYEAVEDIDAMEEALRESLAGQTRYSFSRGWWQWDRLRCRYVDDGRRDRNCLKILRAVFRGLILDRHAVLQAQGEGDLLYLLFTTLRGGKREEVLKIDGRQMLRDVHGGGTHGGWGGAARMRIYEEHFGQNQTKRLLVCVHDAEGQSYYVARHPTSADISRSIPTNGFAAAAIVKAGEPKVFLTVVVPHDDTENTETVVSRIKTKTRKDRSGNCIAVIGNVTVSIQADGTWNSARSVEKVPEFN